jgi:hypothetical protein
VPCRSRSRTDSRRQTGSRPPTSANTRAATIGPTPGSSIKVEPLSATIALSSLVSDLVRFSFATRSASCSAARRRRVLPTRSRGRTEARIAAPATAQRRYCLRPPTTARPRSRRACASRRSRPSRWRTGQTSVRSRGWSTTSMVADSLWGSTPMTILCMCYLTRVHERVGRRGGHCYCELGTPLWSHTAPRCSAVRKPKESHTRARVGSRKEGVPPSTWTEFGLTPVLTESSSSLRAALEPRSRFGVGAIASVRPRTWYHRLGFR